MSTSPWVLIPLRKAKVNYVNDMLLFLYANQEIVWLDISVQETVLVDKLYTLQHLNGQHQHRLEAELALAVVEQIFKRGA